MSSSVRVTTSSDHVRFSLDVPSLGYNALRHLYGTLLIHYPFPSCPDPHLVSDDHRAEHRLLSGVVHVKRSFGSQPREYPRNLRNSG